jgi:ABC-type transport system involved in cytochrome c biogenesis ATPase subunit
VADRILTEEAPRADGHAVASVLLDVDDHNGAGKSTLLRALSGTLALQRGTVGGAENDRP